MLMICSITEHKRMKYAPLKKNLVINSVLNYWDKHIGIWTAGLTISQLQHRTQSKSLLQIEHQEICGHCGMHKNIRHHDIPLPSGFVPTSNDCSVSEESDMQPETAYNIEVASFIGLLIYLEMTWADIYMQSTNLLGTLNSQDRTTLKCLLHLLRYLRDNSMYGLRYYSEINESPIYQMLLGQNIQEKHHFFGFTDSSWNDEQGTGMSTGSFITTYMGGIVDHRSNTLDPVALSSAEAE